MILVDSNIFIDVFTHDKIWMEWSRGALEKAAANDRLAINQVVIAEVAPAFQGLDAFLSRVASFEIICVELTFEAAHCGGVAFMDYRRRRKDGTENAKSIIADFLIGGQAQVAQASILTRDPRFYRSYFPSVPLITPDKAEP